MASVRLGSGEVNRCGSRELVGDDQEESKTDETTLNVIAASPLRLLCFRRPLTGFKMIFYDIGHFL